MSAVSASAPTLVLFWSYKGGQGRSWACTNIALDLAFRGGARVLLLDADFKAPGLHYYLRPFLSEEPDAKAKMESLGFGLIDGLLRWYVAYSNAGSGDEGQSGFDFRDPELFRELLGTVEVPTSRNAPLPPEGWTRQLDGQRGKKARSGSRANGAPAPGTLAEVILPVHLDRLRTQIATEEPELLPAQVGELWLAPCGNVEDVEFRKRYGEGYPWRVLTDPRSEPARGAPLTFADAFYAAVSHLAETCGAEYVFVDLPAGVSNLAEQLIEPVYGPPYDPPYGPVYGDGEGRERFQWGEPSGLVAVTSLAHQALEGTAALLNGRLMEPPPGAGASTGAESSGGYRPRVVRERRATVLYNLLHENMMSLRQVVEQHSRETGIPADYPARTVLPRGGFEIHPKLGMSEWTVLLPEVTHSYVGSRAISRDELAALRVRALNTLEVWTRTDYRRRGRIPRLRAQGDFWSRHRTEAGEVPAQLVLAGEDVPALDAFVEQLLEAWGRDGGSAPQLTLYRFHHQDLFDALEMGEAVTDLRRSLDLPVGSRGEALEVRVEHLREGGGSEPEERRLSLEELWATADAVAVPHYLLGRVTGWGVLDLEQALGAGAREALEQQVEAFEELCCHRGVWCAYPFSVVAKLVFSREPLGPDRRRFADLEALLAEDGEPWILTEARADSLSLWYEWEQLLVSSGARLVTYAKGDHVGRLLDGDAGSPAVDAVFRSVELYWRLIRSQRPADIGQVDWTNAAELFASHPEYRLRLGWSDWSAGAAAADGGRGAGLHFGPLPVEDVSSPRQPLEGWVLALPQPASAELESRRRTARALQVLTSPEWQRAYQLRGGGSAFTTVLRDPEVRSRLPWIPYVADAVEGAIPKGKNRTAPEYAQAVASFLTYVLFEHPDRLRLAPDEAALRRRFDHAWPPFHDALSRLRDRERLT